MQQAMLREMLHALARGLRLRCPSCGLGRLFERGYHMRATCPYCGARFERLRGESFGAVVINAVLTTVVAMAGFFALHSLVDLPDAAELLLWVGVALVFPALTYRRVRGLWVAVAHLTGAVYPDPDYERQYFAPQRRTRSKQRTEDGRRTED